MIRLTLTASRQIDELVDHFVAKRRDEAIENLNAAARSAYRDIEHAPLAGRPYPTPYPDLRRLGFLWLKVHRYWFGYSLAKGYPVVTNVFYESADIPSRVAAEDDETLLDPPEE